MSINDMLLEGDWFDTHGAISPFVREEDGTYRNALDGSVVEEEEYRRITSERTCGR